MRVRPRDAEGRSAGQLLLAWLTSKFTRGSQQQPRACSTSMGGAQRARIGAQGFLADTVTVGMVLELGGLTTGIKLSLQRARQRVIQRRAP